MWRFWLVASRLAIHVVNPCWKQFFVSRSVIFPSCWYDNRVTEEVISNEKCTWKTWSFLPHPAPYLHTYMLVFQKNKERQVRFFRPKVPNKHTAITRLRVRADLIFTDDFRKAETPSVAFNLQSIPLMWSPGCWHQRLSEHWTDVDFLRSRPSKSYRWLVEVKTGFTA